VSKRSKDLFHLLEQRELEVGSSGSAPPVRRRQTRGPTSIAERLRQWLGTAPPPASGRGQGAARPAPAPVGLVLAAVALVSLGAGFLLGRFLPSSAAAATLTVGQGADPLRPGPIEGEGADAGARRPAPRPGAGELSAEKEEETLSTHFFRLLTFSVDQRAEAAQAATYLRASGVDSVRIRKFETTAVDKREVWVVLAYVTSREAAADVLAKLQTVPATRTWPSLAPAIAKLTVTDLKRIEPPQK
jgi:hypothetical protein